MKNVHYVHFAACLIRVVLSEQLSRINSCFFLMVVAEKHSLQHFQVGMPKGGEKNCHFKACFFNKLSVIFQFSVPFQLSSN